MFRTSALALIALCVHPAGAAPAKPAAKSAAKAAAKPAALPVTKPAADGAAAQALLARTEAKITAAKSLVLTSSSTATGPMLPHAAPILVKATLESPSNLLLDISWDGKAVGKIVAGPDGGWVYDSVGNRYIKLDRGATPQDTVRMSFRAASAILPPGVLLGMYAPVSFLMEKHPLHLPGDTVKCQAAPATLNGVAVTHVTQSLAQGPNVTTLDLFVDRTTELPVRVSFSGATNGQVGGKLQADFSSFQLADTQPAATFEYAPPATATAYALPAVPRVTAPPPGPGQAPAAQPAPGGPTAPATPEAAPAPAGPKAAP